MNLESKKARNIGFYFGAIAALSLSISSFAQDASAENKSIKALLPVKVITESFSPYTVAKELGYFTEEGLDVELVAVGGSNEVAVAIASGVGDIGAASPGQAIIGMQPPQDLNVKYFFETNYRSIWTVTVLPDSPIRTIADLKGKRLGVAALGSAGMNFGQAIAAEAGLDKDRDITFISVGSGAQPIQALQSNAVDALVFSSNETAKFEANGFDIRYVDVGEGFASFPDVGLLAQREKLENDRDTLVGFSRAVAKGYLFTMENPEAAVKITWDQYPESLPRNMSEEDALRSGVIVNQRRMEIWSSTKVDKLGEFVVADWERLIKYMTDQGLIKTDLPIERVLTNEFIDEINDFDQDAIKTQAKNYVAK